MYVEVSWLFGFYGISTILGYLMLIFVYTYIRYIWFVNKKFLGNIFRRA